MQVPQHLEVANILLLSLLLHLLNLSLTRLFGHTVTIFANRFIRILALPLIHAVFNIFTSKYRKSRNLVGLSHRLHTPTLLHLTIAISHLRATRHIRPSTVLLRQLTPARGKRNNRRHKVRGNASATHRSQLIVYQGKLRFIAITIISHSKRLRIFQRHRVRHHHLL